jgi:hypothetical protein
MFQWRIRKFPTNSDAANFLNSLALALAPFGSLADEFKCVSIRNKHLNHSTTEVHGTTLCCGSTWGIDAN